MDVFNVERRARQIILLPPVLWDLVDNPKIHILSDFSKYGNMTNPEVTKLVFLFFC